MRYFFSSLVLSVFLSLSSALSVSADFSLSASESAQGLVDIGVINSQSSTSGYRLNDTITRAEMAKIVANLHGIPPLVCTGERYPDVNTQLGDLCGYIEALAQGSLVDSSLSRYRPSDPVTRAEMIKMTMGMVGESGGESSYSDVTSRLGDLHDYITYAEKFGCLHSLFPGTFFYPNRNVTRGETFQVGYCSRERPVMSDITDWSYYENTELGIRFRYPKSFVGLGSDWIDTRIVQNSDTISIVFSNGDDIHTLQVVNLYNQGYEEYIAQYYFDQSFGGHYNSQDLSFVFRRDGTESAEISYVAREEWYDGGAGVYRETEYLVLHGLFNKKLNKIILYPLLGQACYTEDAQGNCIIEDILSTVDFIY